MADQTKEVKKHQTNTEIPYDNGPDCSNLNSKEQTRKTSPEFNPSNEYSVNLALKVATSLLQSVFLENRPVVLPVHLQLAGGSPPQVGEAGLSPLILAASSTVSMPLALNQHLNSQLQPSLRSCPFVNVQTSTLLENLLLCQPEALLYHIDAPVFQSPGTATCLQDLIPSLSKCASAEYEMTGPENWNFLPHEIVQPTSTPMISLIPPVTLLVPYPFLLPLPVPLPIPFPMPVQIPQSLDSKTFTKTSKTGSTIDKSTQTLPTISCCTNSMACPIFPHTPSMSQDEVVDLSLKANQTKQLRVLSASPNSALDLSVVRNRNNITRSKYVDYNGKIVCPTQTVKVIVSPTETVPAPLSDKRSGFSWDYMINSPMKPDRIQDTVVQGSSRRLSTTHPLCSEPETDLKQQKCTFQKGRVLKHVSRHSSI
uniref:Si:ch211-161f7.2 n=1 Tax=Sinocyclocheilus anshuiensis TaxID=1608454 RepID=A0A671NMY8_9TELE